MFGDSSSVELHSLFFCIFFRTKGLVFDQLALMVYYLHKRIFYLTLFINIILDKFKF